MEPLIYAIPEKANIDGCPALTPCSQMKITEAMWEELAAHLATSTTLIPYSAYVLSQRCQDGYSAIVVQGEHIVSHISLAPIVERAPGKHNWSVVTQALNLLNSPIPSMDVYEFTSSWTDPVWRGKHISKALRSPLVERWFTAHTLGISGMLGLASPVLTRLGWSIMAWNEAPYVNSLIAVPGDGFWNFAAYAWCIPAEIKAYQGPHLPLEHPVHQMEKFFYCWVSNPATARQFNQELSALMEGDLVRWRAAIISAFCRPESHHRLAFTT